MVHAQSSKYVYDANGRVVAVTASSGTSVRYGYNTLGNAAQVGAPIAAGQLAIFAFMPTHGEAGTQVAIQGQGFDSNPANDTVSFDGVAATVMSASSTQLVTTVPNGVTTGPISVTVGAQTATSATPFTVDDTGVPPTITQMTPIAVASGGSVTVAGAHLDPVAGQTVVQVGGLDQSLSSLSDNQLQFAASTAVVESGTVSVSTPYGVALSPTPLFVLAGGLNPANFVSGTTATVNGAPVSLAIGAGGQMGGVLFYATAGSWLSLQLTTITTSANNLSYQIYGPGNVLIQSGAVSTSSPSIHLPQLTATGNYVVIFQPDTAGAQLSVAVQTDLTLVNTSPYAIATSQAWQSEGLVFTASSGANLELELTGLNVTGGSQNQVAVQISNAVGSVIASFNCTGSATTTTYCHQPLWNMAAGMYRVTVIPSYGGTMAFNAILQPDVIGPALTPNTPLAINMSAGQMERVSFTATAGQSVALSLANITTAGQFLAVFVYSPNTANPTFSNYYALLYSNNSNIINLPNLPTSGTYTVVLGSADSVPVTGQLTLLSNVGGPLPIDGSNHRYATSASGQSVYLSFSANDGGNLALELTNLNIFGGGQNTAGVQVTNAAGMVIASISCAGSANTATYCHVPLWNMTAGSYIVTVYPLSGGTMMFGASLQPNIIGPALTPNTPLAFDLSAGQVERVTFNGTAGQALALSLSNVSTVDGRFLAVIVYAPNVGAITWTNYYGYLNSNNSTLLNLGNLPVSGTYTVVIGSADSAPTTGQLTLIPGQEGTVPTDGTSQTYSTNLFNQDVGLSFTANTGDNLELELTNVNVNGGSPNQVTVQVSDAAGNVIGTVNCPGSTTAQTYCHQPLWNLAAGTYSALVYPSGSGTPNGGGTMAFNALVAPDVIGPTLTSNSPLNINLSAGPMERVTFDATAGQTATLSLSNVNAAGGRFMAVFVYTPNTSPITMSNYYGLLNSSNSPTLTLPNLPATGTYSVVIGAADSAPASAQLTLTLQ